MAVIISPLKYYFSLDGNLINLHYYEGGLITGEIVEEANRDKVERKHLAGVTYTDFILQTRVNDDIKEMIRKAWEGDYLPRTCSLVTINGQQKITQETVFSNSLLTETIIPTCDGTSKDAAFLGFRIKPETIQIKKGDESIIQPKFITEKFLLKANFKFELGNLPCLRIAKIESFSVTTIRPGNFQNPTIVANQATNQTDIGNIYLTISKADFTPWFEWYKEFVIDGKNTLKDELTGRLVFLAPNMRDELFAIKLGGVGIFQFEQKMIAANQVSRFNVGLYCNQIEIEK